GQVPDLASWRSFAIVGTSFPQTMAEIKTSPVTIPRNEWLFYKTLVPSLVEANLRIPCFGDYGINYPEVLQTDMRLLKPSGTIRYAIDDAWLIVKGPNVRDYGFGQYRNHCKTVANSGYYFGPTFSMGDKYISDC